MKINPKIYYFSVFDTGYSSAHSLIRELFDSPNSICPSLYQGNLLYVLSKTPPSKPLYHTCKQLDLVDKNTKILELETHIAFCNRHRGNIIPKIIYPKEGLDKFCSLTGLKKSKATCVFLGPHKEQKFNIYNSFRIEGTFNILNHNKFNYVLQNGVGSRKSYGYGLILIKKRRKT